MSLRKFYGFLVCCALATAVSFSAQTAQAQVDVEVGPVDVEVGGRNADSTSTIVRRASDVQGIMVKNSEGAELGHVEDLVIDLGTGRIQYAALAYGGFLGVGDSIFAVPWDNFEIGQNDDGEEFLLLNIEEEVLKDAPGFDQNDWPDVATADWSQEIDDYYNQSRE